MQADDAAGLAVGPISLHHLAALRKPLAAIGLHEDTALVAEDRRIDDVYAGDDPGLGDVGHRRDSV